MKEEIKKYLTDNEVPEYLHDEMIESVSRWYSSAKGVNEPVATIPEYVNHAMAVKAYYSLRATQDDADVHHNLDRAIRKTNWSYIGEPCVTVTRAGQVTRERVGVYGELIGHYSRIVRNG